MLLTVLRFNFASPQGDPRTQSRLLSAALELGQWGETRGITSVSVDEHHVTGHGWSCNPIMAASMFLARTSTLIASVDCALGPLWNPVRMAEDLALEGARRHRPAVQLLAAHALRRHALSHTARGAYPLRTPALLQATGRRAKVTASRP